MDPNIRIGPKIDTNNASKESNKPPGGGSHVPFPMNEKIQKTIEINLKGLNTGGSDMVTRTMQQKTGLCQNTLVTDKEIGLYFKSIRDKKNEEAEIRKAQEEELQSL